MLTKGDVRFIQDIRGEVRENRTVDVVVRGVKEGDRNPITGESVEAPYEEEVEAIVTEVSVRTAVDRYFDAGIELRTGDIIVDISLEDMPEDVDNESIESIAYDGKDYTIISTDKLGLGGYNRIESIGRRTK